MAWGAMSQKKTLSSLLDSMNLKGLGDERVQNNKNDEHNLDITHNTARIDDKIIVAWKLQPVEPSQRKYMVNHNPNDTQEAPDIIANRAPIRLVCVIDASHSMAEPFGPEDEEGLTKLDKVKLFANLLCKWLGNEDYLGIVAFGTKSKVVFPLKRIGPDVKDYALAAIDDIKVEGVTHLSAGLMAAVEQFNNDFMKSGFFDDNIVMFTDGMANEGIVDSTEMISELRKKIQSLKDECKFEKDYTIKISTVGTGGFLPELIFDISQAFSSDAFYFLDENINMELNLMKPILLQQLSLVTNIQVSVNALNGVMLDKSDQNGDTDSYHNTEKKVTDDDTEQHYFIHNLTADLPRHLMSVLTLPKKHKKLLKDKDVLRIDITYRDIHMIKRTLSRRVSYSEIPKKNTKTFQTDALVVAKLETRRKAVKTLCKSADCMKRLNRTNAKSNIQDGANEIRVYCDHLLDYLAEETYEDLTQHVNAILANLEHCEKFIMDYNVKWDDAWGKLKALSSSLAREVPTASGVYVVGSEMFVAPKMESKLSNLCNRLRELYRSHGLDTSTIEKYYDVIIELQAKLQDTDSTEAEENSKPDGEYFKFYCDKDMDCKT